MLALSGAADPAFAFKLFGRTFFEKEKEPLTADSRPYEVEFVVLSEEKGLTKKLRGASQLVRDQDEVPASTAVLIARARGDYSRILAALYTEGRYGGVIDITVAGTPVEQLDFDADLPDPAPVVVTVSPGPLFVFGKVGIVNPAGPIPDDDDVPKTPAELGLVPGAPARSGVVLTSEAALVGRWREKGYPKADIASRQATAVHPREELDVEITVSPGPYAVFGPVTTTGTTRMNPDFVSWYTGIQQGKRFDPDDVDRARKQMRRLEVFQAIQIVEGEVTYDGELPIEVTVAERPLRVWGIGATYSTLDGAGVEAFWQHRNLFGQAERLRIEGRVGGVDIQTDSLEDFEYFAGVSFLKPGVFTPFTDFTAKIFAEQESPDTYVARTVGARVGIAHRFFEHLTGSAGARIEASRITDAVIGGGDFLFAGLPLGLVYDTRDNELNPTRGVVLSGGVEPFYEFQFGNAGVITKGSLSSYYALDNDRRFILAGLVEAGSIAGPPLDEIPATELFLLGGGGSIRGYEYRSLGPIEIDGRIGGGRSFFEGSVEFRAQVTDSIGIVPFLDFGNAFTSVLPDFSSSLYYGAGLGLRYFTGIGPIRADIAFPLSERPDGSPPVAFYIGIGQAF